MKALKLTLLFIFTTLLSFGVCSCSNDDNESDDDTSSSVKLSGNWLNSLSSDDEQELFAFDTKNAGSIVYQYSNYPGDDEYEITASGTYTVSGTTITAFYSDVRVYLSNGGSSYKGFTNKKSVTKTYTIVSTSSSNIVLRDNSGVTLRMEKY